MMCKELKHNLCTALYSKWITASQNLQIQQSRCKQVMQPQALKCIRCNEDYTLLFSGIVNDGKPMPCSNEDSKDIPYLKAVFNFIEARPDQFDTSRIYAEGFSQNSMFSAYIGFCFNDKVVGIWQGGSGMALTGLEPNLPGMQGQCTASSFDEHGRDCSTEDPCTECQYWPIYPCYQEQRPMIDCVAEYVNDGVSVSKTDSSASSAIYMYEKLLAEGHDARLMRFSPSDDGTIEGNHQNPKNYVYWQVGCWGITSPCSQSCEDAFTGCVELKGVSTAAERVDSFSDCIEDMPAECADDCSPTLNMLRQSEDPTTLEYVNFGADTTAAHVRPATSLCVA